MKGQCQSDPDRTNALTSGHRACQGCGGGVGGAIRIGHGHGRDRRSDGRGQRDRLPRGLLHSLPETSWQIPWLHSLFGNAAAVATGVAAALRVTGRSDVASSPQAGDGGTVDIGMGTLSGMFERNDDVLFICYDSGPTQTPACSVPGPRRRQHGP